jgi:predicted transglutaminase-like cysteine proteinase
MVPNRCAVAHEQRDAYFGIGAATRRLRLSCASLDGATAIVTGVGNGYSSDTMNAAIAVFLLGFLVASNSEAGELAMAKGPTTAVIGAMTHDRAQDQVTARAPDGTQIPRKVAALDPAESSIVPLMSAEPFGLNVEPVATGDVLRKWSGVEADIGAESKVLASCRENSAECPPEAQKFLAIVEEGESRSGRARIGVINRAVNLAIRPMSDLAQWGEEDRWTAPLATLTTGRGDCEDYAIAKYAALREAGVAAADVKLVVVRDFAAGEDHAVVAARLDGGWIMLDNRRMAIVDDEKMRGVVPLLVLDSDGVKKFEPVPSLDTRYAPDWRASTRRMVRTSRALG